MFPGISRRRVLGTLARFLPWALFSGSAVQILHAAEVGAASLPARALLPSVLRELFPHAGLGDEFYAEMAGVLWQQMLADPVKLQEAESGLARLSACCGSGGWEHAGTDARVAALTGMQEEMFFQALRDSALMLIYRDPRVWEHIGYGGNALAHGGYLTRGFDHIDWLPGVQP